MRIGIITIFNVHNYGAMLQCWSLCNTIKKLGHEPVLVHIPFPNEKISFSDKVKKTIQYRFKHDFVNKYLPYTENLSVDVDAYLVGSDQVWNPFIVGEQLDKFFVNFAKDNRPIGSFASSFGLEAWPLEETKDLIKGYLSKFKIISVRENSGVELLKSTFDIQASEVLDPCFLTDDYSSLFSPDNNPSDIVFFKLRPWKSLQYREIETEAKKRGLSFFNLSGHRFIPWLDKSLKGYNEKYYSVSIWLKKISSAKYVITDSFHGMVFSIIFKRQFVVINSNQKSITRMRSLLSKLDLCHRIVKDVKEGFRIIDNEPIDYVEVEKKIGLLKEKSREKLKEILDNFSCAN